MQVVRMLGAAGIGCAIGASVSVLTSVGALAVVLATVVALALAVLGLRNTSVALYLYAASLPFESEMLVFGSAGTIARLLGLLLLVSFLIHRRRPIRWRLLSLPLLAWAAWTGLSLLWLDYDGDWYPALTLIQLLVVTYVVAHLVGDRYSVGFNAALAYSIGASLVASWGIWSFVSSGASEAFRVTAIDGQSAAHFGVGMIPLFFVGTYMLLNPGRFDIPDRLLFPLAGTFVCLATVAIWISGTRSAWVGVAVGVIVMVATTARHALSKSTRAIAIACAAIALAAVTLPSLVDFAQSRFQAATASGGAGRVDIWAVGLGVAADKPVLGVGFGGFEASFTSEAIARPFFETDLYMPLLERSGPHNIFLSALVETGLIGLALWLIAIARMLMNATRQATPEFATAAFAAMLGVGFFLDILNRKYFWFVAALVLGFNASQTIRGTVRARPAGASASPPSTTSSAAPRATQPEALGHAQRVGQRDLRIP